MKAQIFQAYQQTPWRGQLKWAVIFILVLVIAVIVTYLYLSVSAQIAAEGMEIQNHEQARENIMDDIANDQARLASLTSNSVMEKRAKELGYILPDSKNIIYVYVPGYMPPTTPDLAPSSELNITSHSLINTTYTQSLWEWLVQYTVRLTKTQNNEEGGQ